MRKEFFKNIKRFVIKIGTSVLAEGRILDTKVVASLARDVSAVVSGHTGLHPVLVSSGAIAAGMGYLGIKKRPSELPKLQALAAAGQPQLMGQYLRAFSKHGQALAQILLTWEDFSDRQRFNNTRRTLEDLVQKGIIPVINENDTVSTREIEFGDNDQLSSMVAALVNADLLVFLSDSDGFYTDYHAGPASRISMVDDLNASVFDAVRDVRRPLTRGGMTSKLEAIQKALCAGIPCVLADGRRKNVLRGLFEGRDTGTLFLPKLKRMNSKKHWIAYIAKAEGEVVIDEGAAQAVLKRGKSLLSKGIIEIRGHFEAGSSVIVKNVSGRVLGKGIVNFTSTELHKIMGLRSDEWGRVLGRPCLDEVLHRDNFVQEA